MILSIVALDAYTLELAKIDTIAKTAELWSLLKKLADMWANKNFTILVVLTDIYGIANKKALDLRRMPAET
ncbi:hypothetical protein [Polynucleobacter finlandensis]|uniref:hypothetical protein n=1 Tax=Polynucleobacter finlandensis TaxID=1855894 RepID=UPI001C20CA40|nr:hypothetical protein [Polynucleobacter finlandensis]